MEGPCGIEETWERNLALYWEMDSFAAAAEGGRMDAEQYIEHLLTGTTMLSRSIDNADLDVTTYVGIAGIFDPAE